MPIHDWTRVEAGIFHAFHHRWVASISDALNADVLPRDYYALPEQDAGDYGPDVLALQHRGASGSSAPPNTAVTAVAPYKRATQVAPADRVRRRSRVVVRHVSGDETVAVVEIVSRGNKDNRLAFRAFVDKAANLIYRRIHLLVIDLFPPGPRDPDGIHAAIWGEVAGQEFLPPPGEPLTLVSYDAADPPVAHIEPTAVGVPLADMPLFLEPGGHVSVPLEATYRTAWDVFPARWREVIEGPATGEADR